MRLTTSPLFRQGNFKKYYGRGAKQLSYNFNYGQFSQAMFGEGRLLLDYPDFVADTWLNLASATWFYTTPQPPKPSMLHVIDGTWQPNEVDRRNGIVPVGLEFNIHLFHHYMFALFRVSGQQ